MLNWLPRFISQVQDLPVLPFQLEFSLSMRLFYHFLNSTEKLKFILRITLVEMFSDVAKIKFAFKSFTETLSWNSTPLLLSLGAALRKSLVPTARDTLKNAGVEPIYASYMHVFR